MVLSGLKNLFFNCRFPANQHFQIMVLPLHFCPHLQEADYDASLQFLPATDSKQLEKMPGHKKKLWLGIGLLLLAVAAALLTGLLVWHFNCELISTTVMSLFKQHDTMVTFVSSALPVCRYQTVTEAPLSLFHIQILLSCLKVYIHW